MAGVLTHLSVFLVLGVVAGGAVAQAAGADPTRPPVGVVMDSASASAEATGPVLQSVLIPKKGRPVAVISGQQVRVGERFGESRLVRVNEREAVLDGPAGVEHLLLTPGVEKVAIRQVTQARSKERMKARTEEQTQAVAGAQHGGKP